MKEIKKFETESKELLNLMINSIYSNNEIFLRELISNASDAIDKYKYLSLTSKGKVPLVDHDIHITLDKKNRTITISDNGIGISDHFSEFIFSVCVFGYLVETSFSKI